MANLDRDTTRMAIAVALLVIAVVVFVNGVRDLDLALRGSSLQ